VPLRFFAAFFTRPTAIPVCHSFTSSTFSCCLLLLLIHTCCYRRCSLLSACHVVSQYLFVVIARFDPCRCQSAPICPVRFIVNIHWSHIVVELAHSARIRYPTTSQHHQPTVRMVAFVCHAVRLCLMVVVVFVGRLRGRPSLGQTSADGLLQSDPHGFQPLTSQTQLPTPVTVGRKSEVRGYAATATALSALQLVIVDGLNRSINQTDTLSSKRAKSDFVMNSNSCATHSTRCMRKLLL
jgi:hypothetical protein